MNRIILLTNELIIYFDKKTVNVQKNIICK